MKNTNQEICLTEGCDGIYYSRGVCMRCYNRLFKRVQRGYTNWGALIESGECKRVKKRCKSLTPAVRRANFNRSGNEIRRAVRQTTDTWRRFQLAQGIWTPEKFDSEVTKLREEHGCG